jgi:ABC-type phosphate transport system substrate-binding protein
MLAAMHAKKFMRLLAALLLFVLAATAQSGEIMIIVSADNQALTLRQDQVADIFLGQSGHFPDGREVIALDLSIGSAIRDEFYIRVAAKTPPLLKAYWTKMIFTGRRQPPREVADSIAVRKLVAANPNLIGYIDRSAFDASVKAVLLVP